MESKKLISDFLSKYRKHIALAAVAWFVITSILAYFIVANSEDINVMMCFGYAKAKFRALFFFLPDNWLSGISVKAGTGHFKRFITTWKSVFEEHSWKMFVYILCVFAASLLVSAAAIYKYFQYQIKKFNDEIVVTGKLLKLNEFQEKHPAAFGKYLSIAGLKLSEQIFQTPFYVWGNDESINKVLGQFLENARAENRKIIVFEKENNLYKNIGTENDVLLNPLEENGTSWDFFTDMKHFDALVEELIKKIKIKDQYPEIEDLIKYLLNMDSSTKQFFQILCFNPFKDIRATLKPFTNIEDNVDTFITMRNQIANDLYYFKYLISKTKNISFYDYYKSDKSVLWITNTSNEKMQNLASFAEKIIDYSIIKITLGEKIIKNVRNTIVVNHSLEDSRKLFTDSKLLLSQPPNTKRLINLFGDSVIEYPSFFKKRYKKEAAPVFSEQDIASGNSFFKYKNEKDVLFISKTQ